MSVERRVSGVNRFHFRISGLFVGVQEASGSIIFSAALSFVAEEARLSSLILSM